MNQYREESFFDNMFGDDYKAYEEETISVKRLNELFQSGSITSQEHSFLLNKLYPIEKRISIFAWLCLSCAVVSWVSWMTFTYNGTKYELMSGENRLHLVSLLAPVTITLFYFAYREIKKRHNVKGFEIALIGLTIAIAQLTVVIPVWLMHLYQ